ncbi:hypothetical protein MIR68_009848 [Amoeboaphelidium protococcarum]|nr:hypothetical protein MIR68_009848 [Amoeboaphelidium protococcarum]
MSKSKKAKTDDNNINTQLQQNSRLVNMGDKDAIKGCSFKPDPGYTFDKITTMNLPANLIQSSDKEVWLMQIPANFNIKSLEGVTLKFKDGDQQLTASHDGYRVEMSLPGSLQSGTNNSSNGNIGMTYLDDKSTLQIASSSVFKRQLTVRRDITIDI